MKQLEFDLTSSNSTSVKDSNNQGKSCIFLDFNEIQRKSNLSKRRNLMLSAIKINEGLIRDLMKSRAH